MKLEDTIFAPHGRMDEMDKDREAALAMQASWQRDAKSKAIRKDAIAIAGPENEAPVAEPISLAGADGDAGSAQPDPDADGAPDELDGKGKEPAGAAAGANQQPKNRPKRKKAKSTN
jgi:hypothetical protein